MRAWCILSATLLANAAAGQTAPSAAPQLPAARLVCTRGQMVRAALVPPPVARSLAALERERAALELEWLPSSLRVVYLLVAPADPEALDELNSQLLTQLRAAAAQ